MQIYPRSLTGNTPTPTDNQETKRGIDTRLAAAVARYNEAQAAYTRQPNAQTKAVLFEARDALRAVRTDAMDAALKAVFCAAADEYTRGM